MMMASGRIRDTQGKGCVSSYYILGRVIYTAAGSYDHLMVLSELLIVL